MTVQQAEELLDKLDHEIKIVFIKSVALAIGIFIIGYILAHFIEWFPNWLRYRKDLKEYNKKCKELEK